MNSYAPKLVNHILFCDKTQVKMGFSKVMNTCLKWYIQIQPINVIEVST